MDFQMSYAQKHAWDNLKQAVNSYAELTGSEVAVVTSYRKATQHPGAGDGPLSSENALALHGHGHLLLLLRQYLEQIKSGLDARKASGESRQSPYKPIPARAEEDYHSQSMARSLASSFQSLKLDNHPLSQVTGNRDQLGRRHQHCKGKRGNTAYNGDTLELNEDLLFGESAEEVKGLDYADEDLETGGNYGYRQSSQRITDQADDAYKFGTSLPVNIAMNFPLKQDGPMRYQNALNPPQDQPPLLRRFNHDSEETPNPETMMASMQALARSVTDDSALIFGDRPRPRLNTGESRLDHRR